MRWEAGVLPAALVPKGMAMPAAADDARGKAAGCQLHSSALERGDFCCVVGVSKKARMVAENRLLKVSFLPLPLWPRLGGEGSLPRSLPKNQAEVKSRGIALLLLAGGCRCYQTETRTGSANAGYLFTVVGFLSLSFFPPSANVGGTPEKGLGVTHCAAC